jgi:hypothetical protein
MMEKLKRIAGGEVPEEQEFLRRLSPIAPPPEMVARIVD